MAASLASAVERVLVRVSADEVVDLTRRLVQIPSVYRPDEPDANERAVADLVTG